MVERECAAERCCITPRRRFRELPRRYVCVCVIAKLTPKSPTPRRLESLPPQMKRSFACVSSARSMFSLSFWHFFLCLFLVRLFGLFLLQVMFKLPPAKVALRCAGFPPNGICRAAVVSYSFLFGLLRRRYESAGFFVVVASHCSVTTRRQCGREMMTAQQG